MSRVKDSEPMGYEQEMVCRFFRKTLNTLHTGACVEEGGEVLTTADLDVITKLADASGSPETVHFVYVPVGGESITKKMKLPLPNFSEYLKGKDASMKDLRVVLNENKEGTLTFVFNTKRIENNPEFYSSAFKDVEAILKTIREKSVEFSSAPVPSAPDERDVEDVGDLVLGIPPLAVPPPAPPLLSWRDRAVEGPAEGPAGGLGK